MDGGPICTLVTCASAQADCGLLGDGCGAVIDCGPCSAPQSCGGGGVASRCGGDAGCTPKTCADFNANCGPIADGCGNTTDCGTCTAPQTCGGAGVPWRCGQSGADAGVCVPTTCQDAGATCGTVADRCGSLTASCGTCVAPASCGGGGVPSTCGGNTVCVPRTCAQANANCGQVGDGCGALTPQCGSCTPPDICGGAGVGNRCGHIDVDAGTCTTGLCLQQAQCDAGTTTVTGVVLAPTNPGAGYGNPDPLPGALVYVPNAAVQAFSPGAACTSCASTVTGDPVVYTTSAVNGSFTLTNVPCGSNIPLVVQLGRWRRQITIPSVACCANTALTAAQTRLPRVQAEGNPNDNIPLIAVVTGSVDTIECVLPKIGIASSQYSLPSGTGRVRFYRDNGANFSGGAPLANTLYDSLTEMMKYDIIVIDCVGGEFIKTAQRRANVEAYANAGGRIFASHYAYVWLFGQPSSISFTPTATWAANSADPPNQDAFIDVGFPRGVTFAQWVYQVGAQAATSTPAVPKIHVNTVRHDFNAVIPPAERWVYGTTNGSASGTVIPLQYTFNTPTALPSAQQCGRVLFSDFHVINANAGGSTWPSQCTVGAMSPQEKVFEYLIFDLSSCITPYIQTCTPRTCAAQGFTCGLQGDGCGGTQQCGLCPGGQTCGGGVTPGVCGGCTALTCAQQGLQCGPAGDGCGNTINCGPCPSGQFCGGGGPGLCGTTGCTPRTCTQQGLSCGPAGDGCGNLIQCGPCTSPDTCGGAGTPGVCGHTTCTPRTCLQAVADCGPIGDGCGGIVQCGVCIEPQTCGGNGVANVCGGIN